MTRTRERKKRSQETQICLEKEQYIIREQARRPVNAFIHRKEFIHTYTRGGCLLSLKKAPPFPIFDCILLALRVPRRAHVHTHAHSHTYVGTHCLGARWVTWGGKAEEDWLDNRQCWLWQINKVSQDFMKWAWTLKQNWVQGDTIYGRTVFLRRERIIWQQHCHEVSDSRHYFSVKVLLFLFMSPFMHREHWLHFYIMLISQSVMKPGWTNTRDLVSIQKSVYIMNSPGRKSYVESFGAAMWFYFLFLYFLFFIFF